MWAARAFVPSCISPIWAVKMILKFTKMHGLGNDFIVIDGVNQDLNLSAQQIVKLADRHLGIGFDQCLIVEPSQRQSIDFNYKIYNANGQEVGQCGNGARCLASFIRYKGLSDKTLLTVTTQMTEMSLQIENDGVVSVDMGKPNLIPDLIPLDFAARQMFYPIPLNSGKTCLVHSLSVGNPHAILVVDDLSYTEIAAIGSEISQHKLFPEGVNVGFMQILSNKHIKLRVYERGCGETQACGSGAVAAAASAILYHDLSSDVQVSLPGGDLRVTWPCLDGNIFLSGPTAIVFDGEVELVCA